MSTLVARPGVRAPMQPRIVDLGTVTRARRLVAALGGRFSLELGIEVDRGPKEIERWALASTLLRTDVPNEPWLRSWRAFERAGIDTIEVAGGRNREELAALLVFDDRAGEGERTAWRLQVLATALGRRHHGRVTSFGRAYEDPHRLESALATLPGWGPVSVRTFLRELRGVWPGAGPPLGARATRAAEHGHLPSSLDGLSALASAAHLDLRDLEAGLYRLTASHELGVCPGGEECPLLALDPEQYLRL